MSQPKPPKPPEPGNLVAVFRGTVFIEGTPYPPTKQPHHRGDFQTALSSSA
jgi:hypothetical protein